MAESESHSVVSKSLRPHVLYSPWNSPGQNTGGGSLSCLQGIFPTQGSRIAGEFFTAEPPGKPKNTGVGSLILSVADLHNPGIELGSPALQVDSLAELPGKPFLWLSNIHFIYVFIYVIYHISIHSSVDGHLYCFHVFVV